MVCLVLLPPACAVALRGYKTVSVWRLAAAASAQRGPMVARLFWLLARFPPHRFIPEEAKFQGLFLRTMASFTSAVS